MCWGRGRDDGMTQYSTKWPGKALILGWGADWWKQQNYERSDWKVAWLDSSCSAGVGLRSNYTACEQSLVS